MILPRADPKRKEDWLRHLQQKKESAERALSQSVELRRALLYLPATSGIDPSLASVLQVWLNLFPGSSHVAPSIDNVTNLGNYMLSIFADGEPLLDETQCLIRHFVYESIPNVSDKSFLYSPIFWKAVLTLDGFTGVKPLSLCVIYQRLRKFDKWVINNPNAKEVDGSIWLDTDDDERHKLLLEISAEFPDYLKAQLAGEYRGAYLDDIALDPGRTPRAKFHQKCQLRNKACYPHGPPVTTGHNLKGAGGALLGTVLQIDNALSPAFVSRYISGMDNAKYTPDGRSPKHDRAYRFASRGHKLVDDLPAWIMFGEALNASLLLSQHTNPVEAELLDVVNFIHYSYVDFLNGKIEDATGGTKWGLPELPGGHYDSLMTMISDPTTSNYGLHDDGKPGLCEGESDEHPGSHPNSYSKFNLVVPTVCIQNHSKKTTSIKFFDKSAEFGPCIGEILCGVVTIHVQLVGVQHTCQHEVSPCLPTSIPFSNVGFSLLL
jgi:hypothetical protein